MFFLGSWRIMSENRGIAYTSYIGTCFLTGRLDPCTDGEILVKLRICMTLL